jgi:8-oxo-dGTP pyrophosphatase MutT (NUDIX family)
LPYRTNGKDPVASLEILLITSRQTQRWIIPKGNIDFHMSPYAAAAQEALEEAGAVGEIARQPLGVFRYCKTLRAGSPVMAKVAVFPLRVVTLLDDWQESDWRRRQWFSQFAALDVVHEPELREIIRTFLPGGA